MLAIINTYIDDPDDKSYMIWLYEEFHRLMFSTARKYTSNQTDCEDIVQNGVVPCKCSRKIPKNLLN